MYNYAIKNWFVDRNCRINLDLDLGFGITKRVPMKISHVQGPPLLTDRGWLHYVAAKAGMEAITTWMEENTKITARTIKYTGGIAKGDLIPADTASPPLGIFLLLHGMVKKLEGRYITEWGEEDLQAIVDNAIKHSILTKHTVESLKNEIKTEPWKYMEGKRAE